MSGATIGGIVGGVVGAFFGPAGAQIGFMFGSAIGGYLDPEHLPGPKLGDIPVQTSMEGAPRPIVYGSPQPFPGNLIQAGPKIIVQTHERQGKGGPVIDGEEVYQSYAIRICEGEATVIQVWRDGKLVFDRSTPPPTDPAQLSDWQRWGRAFIAGVDGVAFSSKVTFYTGSEDQQPDPTLESLPAEYGGGIGNVPAYVGTAYMVVTNDNLTPTGGRIPNYEFRMASNATVTESCTEEGLIAWWPLDDAAGGGVAREIVAGRDGVYSTGCTSGPPLHIGGSASLYMETIYDYMIVDGFDQATFDTTGTGWTVSAWCRPQVLAAGGVIKNVATYWESEADGYANWSLRLDGTNNMAPSFAQTHDGFGGVTSLDSAIAIGTNQTVYMVATFTPDDSGIGTGTHRLYVNGSLVDTQVGDHGSGKSGNRVAVGGYAFPSSYGFIGWVQDVKLYNYPLTADEVAARYLGTEADYWEIPEAPGTYVDAYGNIFSPCSSVATTSAISLADIERDIAARCGISAAQLDVAADEAVEVDGYLIGRQMSGAAALGPLAVAYFRDLPEYDLQIHSVPRGGEAVATLTDDDFVDDDEDELSLRQKIELPRKVNLAFSDPANNYARVIVPAERESINVPSTGVTEVELPLVLDRNVAAQKAEIILKCMTEEAYGTLKRKLPFYKYASLVPSDCITYDNKRWRLDRVETVDGVTSIEAKRDRVLNYTSVATANGVLDPTAPVSSAKGPSVLRVLNLPRLKSEHTSPGLYLACTGLLPAWPGALIYMSDDGGLTERLVTTISTRATMGRVAADCTASSEPITVTIFDNRELASITDAQMLLRMNGAAITSSGVSEVVQFKTVEQNEDGNWELTDVLRGQLDTVAASHADYDDFLVLDEAVQFLPLDSSLIGKTLIFRAVTRGTARENNATVSIVFEQPTEIIVDGGEVTP